MRRLGLILVLASVPFALSACRESASAPPSGSNSSGSVPRVLGDEGDEPGRHDSAVRFHNARRVSLPNNDGGNNTIVRAPRAVIYKSTGTSSDEVEGEYIDFLPKSTRVEVPFHAMKRQFLGRQEIEAGLMVWWEDAYTLVAQVIQRYDFEGLTADSVTGAYRWETSRVREWGFNQQGSEFYAYNWMTGDSGIRVEVDPVTLKIKPPPFRRPVVTTSGD